MLTDFGIAREAMFLRQPGVAQTLAATGMPWAHPNTWRLSNYPMGW